MSICFTFTIYMLVNVQSEKKKLCSFYTGASVGVRPQLILLESFCVLIFGLREHQTQVRKL